MSRQGTQPGGSPLRWHLSSTQSQGFLFSRPRANYFVGQFAFGDLTLDETLESVELFKDRVVPALQTAEWMEETTVA